MGGRVWPPDNRDATVRRWLAAALAQSQHAMVADPRERRAISDRLVASIDDRSRLVLDALDRRYDEGELTRLGGMLDRVLAGEPVQRVVGWTEFRGLRIGCAGDVLIPRPETEEVVGWFLEAMEGRVPHDRPCRVLDVGTGSGCMALAIQSERPNWEVHGLDVSPAALDQAKSNADMLGGSVRWHEADGLDPGAIPDCGVFDGIVSNPPYIEASETLASHVVDHEPGLALFVPDGEPLRFYKALREWAVQRLVPGGCMVAECHRDHVRNVENCWQLEGAQVERLSDLQGAERAVRLVRD